MMKIIKYSSYALILLGLLIHLWVGIKQPLFGDEANSILMARESSYQTLVAHQIEKTHPNGSYLITKILWDLGLGITGIRVVHWFLFCLTLWPVYSIYKQLGLSKTSSLIGLIIWTLSPYLLLQSYLIRMYVYGILTVVYSLYFSLRKQVWASTIMDLLGVYFVSGYWIYVIAKHLALGKKNHLPTLATMAAAFVINFVSATTVSRAVSTYLNWMPQVRLPDILSMFTTLLGLTSPAYYEGYSQTPSSLFLTLSLTIPIIILVVIFLGSKHKLNDAVKYFLRLTIVILIGYLSIWILSLFLHLPLFHVRQLFSIAVVSLLFLTYITIKNFSAHKFIVLLLTLPLLLLGAKRTTSYMLHPIYPEHMIIKSLLLSSQNETITIYE